MTFDEYQDFIFTYVPDGMNPDEFIDTLAIGTIGVLQHASKTTNVPIQILVNQIYSNNPNKN